MAEGVFTYEMRGSLLPADAEGQSAVRGLKPGDCVKVKVTRPRNLPMHNWFWKFCTVIAENCPTNFPNATAVSDALKIASGHVEHLRLIDGTMVLRPKSIAFHKFDDAQFREFVGQCKNLVGKHLMPKMTKQQWDAVDAMLQ